MDSLVVGRELGSGQFATVYEATMKESGERVALKKIHITDKKEGIHVTTLREMKLLREIQHPNVIRLIDVFSLKKNNVGLVLEFMDTDLEAVIKDRSVVLSPADVKGFMLQLLTALGVCHANYIVHRDVKPNNCLINKCGVLKLADFGLARNLGSPERDPGRPYTHEVFARWYRAPELFFGATSYGFSVDIWAAGCILAELLLRRPWFPGVNDIDQLGRVFQALGTPTEDNWPGVSQLPCYLEFTPVVAPPLRGQFPTASDECLSFLAALMSLDPRKRPTARQALQHSWFKSEPLPTPPARLPLPQTKAAGPAPPSAPSTEAATGQEAAPPAAKRARLAAVSGSASPALAPDAVGKFSPRPGQTIY